MAVPLHCGMVGIRRKESTTWLTKPDRHLGTDVSWGTRPAPLPQVVGLQHLPASQGGSPWAAGLYLPA